MNTPTATEAAAAPAATAELFRHDFNSAGVCETPEVVIIPYLPKHYSAVLRLALAEDGWRVGFEYEGPPVGVGMRGVLPALAEPAYGDRLVALAAAGQQLLAALAGKQRARKAVSAIETFLQLHAARNCPIGPDSPRYAAGLQVLTLEDLALDGANPRRAFAQAELLRLAESIEQEGILQPLVVRGLRQGESRDDLVGSDSAQYVVVAGERRYRAAQILADRQVCVPVPCVVYAALSPERALVFALTENLQREGMNPIEEAEGYARLSRMGYTQEYIAELVHKSRPVVGNAMRLLELPEVVREHLRSGALSTAHGVALARFKAWPLVVERIATLAIEHKRPAGSLEEGLPFGYDLEGEGLVAYIDIGEFAPEQCDENDFPVALKGVPWVFVDRTDTHQAELYLWAMDLPAWTELRAKLAAARRAMRPAPQVRAPAPESAPEEGESEGVTDGPAADQEQQAAAEAAWVQSAKDLDTAWAATAESLRQLTEVRRDHLALLVGWASDDYRIGQNAENVAEAAEAVGLDLPRGVKTVGTGTADKLAKLSPVELVRFALALRARAQWRIARFARQSESPVPVELTLFRAEPAPKKVKKAA